VATRILSVGIFALLVGSIYATVAGQTPPRDPRPQPSGRQIPVGTAAITGVVLSADTGAPLRNARVTLNGTAGVIPAGRGVPPPTNSTPQPTTLPISRMVATDAQGRFTFARLAQGRYAVAVSRDGYLQASYGQRRPNAGAFQAIELADGEQRVISISLSRGGVIAGTVVDEYGEPTRNAQVQLWRIDATSGVKRLQQTNGVASNDRGVYRFFGLQPGTYLVSVFPRLNDVLPDLLMADQVAVERAVATGQVQTPASGPAYVMAPAAPQLQGRITMPQFLPVYFPGTFSPATAQPITITGSEEREGVDLTLLFSRAAVVRGSVSPPPPEGTSTMVSLLSTELLSGNIPSTGVNQTDGTFVLENVPPGRYTLLVFTRSGPRTLDSARVLVDGKPLETGVRISVTGVPQNADAEQRLFAHASVVVSGDAPLDVALSLRPALTLSGTVHFDMAKTPAVGTAQQVQLVPLAGQQSQLAPGAQAAIRADGTFSVNGVLPGRYFLRVPWTMRSATVAGQDVLELPFDISGDRNVTGVEITVTDKTTEVSGTLTDAAGNPLGNRLVTIAPSDQQQWFPGTRRIAIATTGPYGRYTLRVPPGDYVVGPIADLENGSQYDPQVLGLLMATGSHVTVTEGDSAQRDFRIR
jgi:uncharacterized protein (DUF2141 family)